ncbi:MAG: ATP-dependent zinc metalloprotease FtsH [Candidatus Gracilibacteria bacterium]|nr:ATP-dependent zinc metalloprotease FtsH [Candidatus Gracilibacteria bacterium]MDD3120585.1 ATP-dependent zinc metalloprotease FtsH [Candidatus Gracilibacteria bacterium]MDD4530987.1 ATP-dependent zinc metalloprotease FtsH [Candidatus Gracilibacteria bacterium]
MAKQKKKDELLNMIPKNKGTNPFILLILVFLIFITIISGIGQLNKGKREQINDNVGINQVLSKYSSGVYSEIVVEGNKLTATYSGKFQEIVNKVPVDVIKKDQITLPPNDKISDLGFGKKDNPTKVFIKDDTISKYLAESLPSIIITIIFVIVFMVVISKMTGGTKGPMAFVKSRARLYDSTTKDKVVFADIAGAEEEKDELKEVVDFLKNPKKYKELGAKIPRGVLMVGPPGTGKTLLARAVAGESGVPFFLISGSEFVEMFVGVGAARVRDLFREAREKAPSIIFIDEIDAIGKQRSPGIGGGHDEREQTLNQILTEMDGFDNETNVIVMAATNRADVLDSALTRPGRFDRRVIINLPTLEDRVKILEVHARNKPLDEDVDLRRIAGTTVGASGADLANILNEAAILAGKNSSTKIKQEHIQKSIEKILLGNTRKSLKMTEDEKKLTAYHEVGHALVGKMLPHIDPVNKISIISRGASLGVTWFLPEKDKVLVSKAKFVNEIAVSYGGRVAEEIFFGKENVTTGASGDIEKATDLARAMIMKYGFDPDIGAENFLPDINDTFEKNISQKTKEEIDGKVRIVLKDSYAKAFKIVSENKELFEKIAQSLIEKEELTKEEFEAFFGSEKTDNDDVGGNVTGNLAVA